MRVTSPLKRLRALKYLRTLLLACAAYAVFAPGTASACTIATANIGLGSHSSYAVGTTGYSGSGSSGLSCDVVLALLTAHYVGLAVDGSSLVLSESGGHSIPFQVSLSAGGPALTVGSFTNLSSIAVLSLFSGTNNTIPLYVQTTPTAARRAGTYTGYIDLRWHYSVCSLGIALCLGYSSSPGFARPLLGAIEWGTGTPVRITISLTVEKDCIIDAPDINFGASPLASHFDPVTQTINIRCSADAAYSVGLDNGSHAQGNVRRMASGSNFLAYEIYKTASSPDRWGATGGDRRLSSTADINPGVYDSVTNQGFTYRAQIDPAQITPPAGVYSDVVRVDVEF